MKNKERRKHQYFRHISFSIWTRSGILGCKLVVRYWLPVQKARKPLSPTTPPSQLSISGDKVADPAHHLDPDEMGEIMWEMRPRFATSAGELKRRKKKEMLAERDRKEVRTRLRCFWNRLVELFVRKLMVLRRANRRKSPNLSPVPQSLAFSWAVIHVKELWKTQLQNPTKVNVTNVNISFCFTIPINFIWPCK